MRKKKIQKICEGCNKEFLVLDNRTRFCSKDCFHRKRRIPENLRKEKEKEWRKNRKKKKCICGKEITNYSKICSNCFSNSRKKEFEKKMKSLTINDCLKISSKYTASNKYQNIRNYAQAQMTWNKIEKKCKSCGYNKHVEVCHIKQISDFPISSTLDIVNSLENLVYLCPNHHWELDNLNNHN